MNCLAPLATETTSQRQILGLNSNSLGVNSSKVGVFEERHKIGLGSLLQSHYSRGLEPEVCLEVLSNFTNEPLEGELPDKKFGRLLVSANLSESNSSRTETMRLLHTTSSGGRGSLARGFGSELLPGSLSSSGLAGGLFSASHCRKCGSVKLMR